MKFCYDWLILNCNLKMGQHSSDLVHKLRSVLDCPKLYIHGMKLVRVFVLVSHVESRKIPFRSVCWRSAILLIVLVTNGQRDERRLPVRILDMNPVHIYNSWVSAHINQRSLTGTLTPVKRILIRSHCVVGNLYTLSTV